MTSNPDVPPFTGYVETTTNALRLIPFNGLHMECALGSADQNVAQPFVNRSSVEESERNIASDSQCRNRLPSIDDPVDPSKEKAVPLDKAEDSDGTSTSAQKSIDEILAIVLSRAQELRRENNVQPNFHSSPPDQYFARPHNNPIPVSDMAHNTLTPEYRIPWASATNVHHHHHYYYNAPNVSPPPIIVKIINRNTSKDSDSSESGDEQ